MIALSNSLFLSTTPSPHFASGSSLNSADKSVSGTTKLAFSQRHGGKSSSSRRSLTIQAGYSDGGRPSSSSIFVGGFLLGGVIIGALGCIFAPEISKALAETDKKDLMRKLPKFIYDEEKALESSTCEINYLSRDVKTKAREETPGPVHFKDFKQPIEGVLQFQK